MKCYKRSKNVMCLKAYPRKTCMSFGRRRICATLVAWRKIRVTVPTGIRWCRVTRSCRRRHGRMRCSRRRVCGPKRRVRCNTRRGKRICRRAYPVRKCNKGQAKKICVRVVGWKIIKVITITRGSWRCRRTRVCRGSRRHRRCSRRRICGPKR